jgi:hypothetical protein
VDGRDKPGHDELDDRAVKRGVMPALVAGIHVLCQAFKQILPVRILCVNEPHFPGPRPMLDRFFALNCRPDIVMVFEIDESFERVLFCETVNQAFPVFIATPTEIARNTGVENTVTTIGHDVHEAAHDGSN